MTCLLDGVRTALGNRRIAVDITLQAEWRPRRESTLANYLSKLQDRDNWMVNCEEFRRLDAAWDPFDIDLLTFHSNHLFPCD